MLDGASENHRGRFRNSLFRNLWVYPTQHILPCGSSALEVHSPIDTESDWPTDPQNQCCPVLSSRARETGNHAVPNNNNPRRSLMFIPAQAMLRLLYDHFSALYAAILSAQPTLASEHALKQEEEVYKKSNKLTYRNVLQLQRVLRTIRTFLVDIRRRQSSPPSRL